jgi:hypothetical protein
VQLSILESGSREGFKAGVHGLALSLVGLMGAYNAAAWLQRRQPHLAFNTIVYAALVFFEYQHVCHHWADIGSSTARAAGVAAVAAAAATADAVVNAAEQAASNPPGDSPVPTREAA